MYLYLFLISFVVNVLLVWYIREYMKRVNLWWQTLRVFKEDVLRYKLIVKEVYGMEVYYGDVTIEKMIKNIGVVSSKIDTFLETSSKIFGDSQ